LVYDDSKPKPEAATVDALDNFDDFTLVPYDKEELFTDPDQTVELTVIMDNLNNGAS
jgi:iron transport multicopper oxidase